MFDQKQQQKQNFFVRNVTTSGHLLCQSNSFSYIWKSLVGANNKIRGIGNENFMIKKNYDENFLFLDF